MKELLKKIPPEKRWAITAKIISSLYVMRGEKIIAPELGAAEGFISPIWGAEKWEEIHIKIFGDGGKLMYPWVKETFNIPVENAIDADDLLEVVAVLMLGPESGSEFGEYVEKSPERVVWRTYKCTWMERYKEFEVDPVFIPCARGCQAWCEEGLKLINPKLTYKASKFMPEGDPYCEYIIEFKDE
jgi:hypothetical protein